MTTLAPARIPAPRSPKPKPPWFTGDVAGIAAELRAAAARTIDGDCVEAVICIEAIQDHARLSAPAKARLTAAVIAAVQLVRGWDAPLAVDDDAERVAGLPVDPEMAAEPTELTPPAPAAAEGPVDDEALLEAVELGGVRSVAAHLRVAGALQPNGDCVEAIKLIAQIVKQTTLPDADRNRRTLTVLEAVSQARGWSV